jgi:tetratricopeptide (TPR) repeat protein
LDGSQSAFALLREAPPEAMAAVFALDVLRALAWRKEPVAPAPPEEPEELAPAIEIRVTGAADGATDEARWVEASRNGELDAELATLREEVLDLHGRLDQIDAYTLLGVERDAALGQIKRAYLKLAKRLHPDALIRRGLEDIKIEANALFAEITRAHAVLSDAEERRSYDAALDGHRSIDADRLAQAESLYRKGEILMKAGNFLGALELLEAAVQLWPEESDYQAGLGWTLFRKNPPEPERARRHLEHAVELDERNATALHRLHYVRKADGDEPGARAALARALEIDPSLSE